MVSGNNAQQNKHRLSSELESIREQLTDNKMSLRLGKTESIIFGSKRTLQHFYSIQVQCAGNKLTRTTSVEYVGVELDQFLTGEGVAEQIIRKSNAKLKFKYRHTRNVNLKAKQLLTSVLIKCYFDYASATWFSSQTKKYKSRLQCTQNKIIRLIGDAPARTHIGSTEV